MSNSNMLNLSRKTAVVTGGGSGIGQAICLRFAAHGAHVEVLERDAQAAEQTKNLIEAEGGSVNTIVCDMALNADVNRAIADIVQRRGEIDILINNAGIASVGKVTDTSEEEMDRVYNVNVKGVYNGLFAVIPRMIAAGGGVILNMASVASLVGVKDRFAYSMSKGAVLTMTYSVAIDYLEHNIRCNCICPARIHTPFVDGYLKENFPDRANEMFEKLSKYQPIGRMGRPEEVAALAVFLCSDDASFITGAAYPIDGGVTTLI